VRDRYQPASSAQSYTIHGSPGSTAIGAAAIVAVGVALRVAIGVADVPGDMTGADEQAAATTANVDKTATILRNSNMWSPF
jgi:hypothetical protein